MGKDVSKPKGPVGNLIKMILALLLKLGPDLFGEDEPGTVGAVGPQTLESLTAAIDAVPPGTTFCMSEYDPGMVGGPVTDELVSTALRSLLEYANAAAEDQLDNLTALIQRFTDRVSFLP